MNKHHENVKYIPPQQSTNSNCRRKKRPTIIIVDKSQRRPLSRLVNDEYARNRDNELEHENLKGYDYLVQEYFIDPTKMSY